MKSKKPHRFIKQAASYQADWYRNQIKQLQGRLKTNDLAANERLELTELIQTYKVLKNIPLEDRERYENSLSDLEAAGLEQLNRDRKFTKADNLDEARSLHQKGDTAEKLRRRLSREGINVSRRTASNYLKEI